MTFFICTETPAVPADFTVSMAAEGVAADIAPPNPMTYFIDMGAVY